MLFRAAMFADAGFVFLVVLFFRFRLGHSFQCLFHTCQAFFGDPFAGGLLAATRRCRVRFQFLLQRFDLALGVSVGHDRGQCALTHRAEARLPLVGGEIAQA